MSPYDRRRGFVLVGTLWIIVLLAALVMAAATSFRSFAGLVTIDRDRMTAHALLTAGLETAAAAVTKLGNYPLTERDIEIRLPTGRVEAHLSDERGKIDIGKAPPLLLAALFRAAGAEDPEDLAQAVVAYRKRIQPGAPGADGQPAANDQAGQQQGQGSAKAPPPAEPGRGGGSGQVFTDIRQLANVPGMPPELIGPVAKLATVYGAAKINALTASSAVIAALPGVDDKRLQAFLEARREPKLPMADVLATLGDAKAFLDPGGQPVASVALEAVLPDGYGAAAQAIIVVLPKDREPYRTLVWTVRS